MVHHYKLEYLVRKLDCCIQGHGHSEGSKCQWIYRRDWGKRLYYKQNWCTLTDLGGWGLGRLWIVWLSVRLVHSSVCSSSLWSWVRTKKSNHSWIFIFRIHRLARLVVCCLLLCFECHRKSTQFQYYKVIDYSPAVINWGRLAVCRTWFGLGINFDIWCLLHVVESC